MLIKKRRYTLVHYLAGALPARLGDEMSGQAILLVALAVTGNIRSGSTVLAALTLSAAIGGPLLGTLLDRSGHPGRILAGAVGLYAAGLILVTVSLGHQPSSLSIILALCVGFLMPAISGGWSSRLKSFVANERMVRASAIDATTFNIAGLIGPGIAGLIAATFGAYWVVAVLAALLVLALPMAWALPKRTARAKAAGSFIHTMTSGFRVILANKPLFRITLMSVISYAGIGMLWVIYPLIGKELFGKSGYGGLLASTLSVSALIATVAYAKWPTKYSPDTIACVTTLLLTVAIGSLLFHTVWIAIIAMLTAGLADGPQLAAIFAIRHREAPERLLSQVFTTSASLKITAAAVGAEVAGIVAGHSLEMTIVIASLVQATAAIAFLSCTVVQDHSQTAKIFL